MEVSARPRLLVTGATGHIGGRLVPRLLKHGYSVRVLARDPGRLDGRSWSNEVEIVKGDVGKPETLKPALEGVDVAYYLVHSLENGTGFADRDATAARNFAAAARAAGIGRIIFLGGLGDDDAQLSQHLQSRHRTGDVLRDAGVPVTEFRAAIVVGAGSVSFEMIRYLTERLPVMVCPRWVFNRIQPIAIDDVLDYLVAALDTPDSAGQVIEIGGADVQTYASMMLIYADERDLKRLIIPTPVLTPTLSSYWIHLITPINATVARPLIEGLRNEVIVRNDSARRLFPAIRPIGYRDALKRALGELNNGPVESSWTNALDEADESVSMGDTRGMLFARRERVVNARPEFVYAMFTMLGGKTGWLYLNRAWQLRGLLDIVFGGTGLRRGRRDPTNLRKGDYVDWWRVEAVEPNHLLRLRAEMKLPGRGWLEFKAEEVESGKTKLVQTAYFAPKGLPGLLYWWALQPVHPLLFSGMIARIAAEAEARGAKAKVEEPTTGAQTLADQQPKQALKTDG